MPAFVPPVQSDQFEQGPIRGDLDLAITRSGVLAGVLDATESGSLKAGDRVKLYVSSTSQGAPKFVAASDAEDAFGTIKRLAKKATFTGGDMIEVAYFGGPAMYQVAAATVTPGAVVEMASQFVKVLAAGKPLGVAIDYALESQMLRVIQSWQPC